jgi:hypothetical protein
MALFVNHLGSNFARPAKQLPKRTRMAQSSIRPQVIALVVAIVLVGNPETLTLPLTVQTIGVETRCFTAHASGAGRSELRLLWS